MRKRKTEVSALPAVDADENGGEKDTAPVLATGPKVQLVDADENGCEKDTARWRKGK